MKILENEDLKKHTTIKIGGTAVKFIVPESIDELLEVINTMHPKYFIGGGSNLLISDKVFDLVVDLKAFDKNIESNGDGKFLVGASVRLQKFINHVNEAGYGGIEYLFSVPGTVGGAVVMNAGRGKKYNQTISDYIVSVDIIRDGKIVTLNKHQCGFAHRNSIFKNSGDIIVSVLMSFPEMSAPKTDALKKDRIQLCKEKQDASKPNFGSVFMECDNKVMNFVRKHQSGHGKVHFSQKTSNWIVNEGGTFEDALASIKKVELYHKLLFRKCIREVIVWE